MRIVSCLLLLFASRAALGATLAEDAYVCRDKAVALRVAADPELSALGARRLSEHVAQAGNDAALKITNVDQEIARTQQRVDADRQSMASAKALEFQAGIRQNLHLAEQAVRDGEARLAGLKADRERFAGEQVDWAAIAASCKAPPSLRNVEVVRVISGGELALVSGGSGAEKMRAWVPKRFIVRSAAGKKN
jgi:hypothetical protein